MRLVLDVADGVHRVEDAHVNWYIVQGDDGLTIVDAGLPASWRSLELALGELGRDFGDLRAIVLTHAHFDHVGFAARASRDLQLPIYLPEGEQEIASHPLRYPHERSRLAYVLRPRPLRLIADMIRAGMLRTPPVPRARSYRDGEVLPVPGRPKAISTPGHTPAHASLLLAERGVVIAGDALVTLDPYTARTGPRLVARAATANVRRACGSLQRLRETGAAVLLPGHGEPWLGGVERAVSEAEAAGAA